MYTKHNGDNGKLRMFYFIPQRQRIQPNFTNPNQTTKQTQVEQPKQRHQRGFHHTKIKLLQLRQRKFWSIDIQILQ